MRGLLHKTRRIIGDPVLRRWVATDAVRRWPALLNRRPRLPGYLSDLELVGRATLELKLPDCAEATPVRPMTIDLAGTTLEVVPDKVSNLMERAFDDTESLLALHRFAWVPQSPSIEPVWVVALWRAWMERHHQVDESWAWHPYTASERLINILGFAKRFGMPPPRARTLSVLALHGQAIFDRLEYHGERDTGNHLANNGRGLFLGGLAVGATDWAEVGARILCREAQRIFAPSGVLREGSSHYHLLATRWYSEAAAVARRHGRPEADEIEIVARRARGALSILRLPGGMPLIGDVSPDCSPDRLLAWYDEAPGAQEPPSRSELAEDGWHRFDVGPWHALGFASRDGWAPIPGHAHEDFGSLEIHWDAEPVLRDFGRRSYGSRGEQDMKAAAHNSLTIDGVGAYPANKPYYDSSFRRRVAGAPPTVERTDASLHLRSDGFTRIEGVGSWQRTWEFHRDRIVILDRIEGRGRRRIDRYLHTTCDAAPAAGGLRIGRCRATFDGAMVLERSPYWCRYGCGKPAASITVSTEATLPWTSSIVIEAPR